MRVAGVGASLPKISIPNETLEARLGLEAGWVERRTGIRERPTAAASEATSDFAIAAGERAIAQSGIERGEIGLLLLATSTPDHLLPPTAPLVAHRLGLSRAGAVDLAGACSGFLYAFTLAAAYGNSAQTSALVIASNVLTRRVNPNDPGTSALFSDGAGAVVLTPAKPSHILGSFLGSDGSMYAAIGIPGGGSREPLTAETLAEGRHLMTIRQGSALFKSAVRSMAEAGLAAIRNAQIPAAAVDWWIPHQANARIIRDAGALLGIPADRTVNVVDRFGNSSAATIPIALAHAIESGQIRTGQTLLLTSAGAGMLSAGVVLKR